MLEQIEAQLSTDLIKLYRTLAIGQFLLKSESLKELKMNLLLEIEDLKYLIDHDPIKAFGSSQTTESFSKDAREALTLLQTRLGGTTQELVEEVIRIHRKSYRDLINSVKEISALLG